MAHALNVLAFSALVAVAVLLTSMNVWSFIAWAIKDHWKRGR